MKFRMLKKKN